MTTRPAIHDTLMDVARVMASRSTCSRALVGVVLARDTRIVATGYNGAPAGLPHCNHDCTCPVWWSDYEHADDCASMQPCETAVHAEANAIAFAAKHGVALNGTTMYTTLAPCATCARLIINAGISQLYYAESYRLTNGTDLLRSADIPVRTL